MSGGSHRNLVFYGVGLDSVRLNLIDFDENYCQDILEARIRSVLFEELNITRDIPFAKVQFYQNTIWMVLLVHFCNSYPKNATYLTLILSTENVNKMKLSVFSCKVGLQADCSWMACKNSKKQSSLEIDKKHFQWLPININNTFW